MVIIELWTLVYASICLLGMYGCTGLYVNSQIFNNNTVGKQMIDTNDRI